MKKISLSLVILSIILSVTPSTFAIPSSKREIKNTVRETVKVERKDLKEEIKEKKESLMDKVKNYMKKNLRFEARVKGTITLTGSNSFSLNGDEGTFQINISDKTKFLRKFGGKSSFSEYSNGDEVIVFGKFTDDTKSIIEAKTVRNNSIQKRKGAFFGKVTIINAENFVMETIERGTQTVYFGTAKIIDRKEVTITLTDIKVGDRVRVKGVWDKTLSKISEVDQIKDFSIPVVVPTQATKD